MRLMTAIKSDLLFQYRSGFHIIYTVLTLFYILIINQLPENYVEMVTALAIFSDPTVLGLFFVGGLIMLEKFQGILDLLVVTPLKVKEYVLSKVISLTFISVASGLIIGVFTKGSFNPIVLIVGIVLTAIFFTLVGIIIALRSHTLNQYFGNCIPLMILIYLPCIGLFWGEFRIILALFPSVSGLKLIMGAFYSLKPSMYLTYMICMCLWNYFLYIYVNRVFESRIVRGGGRNV